MKQSREVGISRFAIVALAVAFAVFVFPSRAQAYLDPSSGSLVLQMAIGGFLSAIAMVKLNWKRLKGLFTRSQNAERTDLRQNP